MDPTGVLSSIASATVNSLLELVKSAIHCKEKCKELEGLLDRASGYLDDLKLKEYAAQGSLISPRLEPWLKALQAAVEEARSPVLQCQSSHVLDIPSRAKIAHKIDECSKRIREYFEEGQQIVGLAVFHEVGSASTSTTDVVPKEEQHFVPPEEHVFGMEETLEEVVSNLLSMESSNKWVGVYGAGGAGKTLLAKRVSKKSRVLSHFDPVLWLTFGQSCQVEAKQKELSKQIDCSLSSGERSLSSGDRINSGDLISNETLSRKLDGKRCLLILDDVWTAGNLDLFDVVQANGSRIFITTRIPHVLDSKGATKTHLGLLGKEDSMKLFMLHAFPNQIDARKQISDPVVQQVVLKCGGLPLVLKVIGRRMAGRQDWNYVLGKLNDQQLASLDEEKQVLQRLKLGYDALASHGFQQHFLYFAAYPEDARISFWQLFRCWKGEGLVANTTDAINVLETLQNYALITVEAQEFHMYTKIHDEKGYRIHDALLSLALNILNTEGPKCYLKAGQKDAGLESDDFKWISLMRCKIKGLQTSKKNKATTCLLLDHNEIPALSSLSNLKNLKVLCLRDIKLVCLPDSIGKLRNLETLDLRNNSNLKRIPSSLENLTKLSYLDVEECYSLQVFPVDALFKFSNLVFFDGGSRDIWKCKRLHHQLFKHEKCLGSKNGQLDLDVMFQVLTKLEVLRLGTGGLNVKIAESISKLSQLKELSINGWQGIIHIHGNFQMTNLEILSLPNVRSLPLDWDWSKFPKLVSLDFGLKGDDDMKATHMENLKFLRGCFNDLSCLTQENFPKLEELELRECKKLIQAHIQLASLKKLSIEDCDSITNLSIPFLPNLKKLQVTDCKAVNDIHISECPSLRHIYIWCLPSLPHFTLAGKFPQLHTLKLHYNERLSSVILGAVDDGFPQLHTLGLRLNALSSVRLQEAQDVTNLEILSLQDVQNLPLDWDWSKFPSLVELDFIFDGDDDIKFTRMENLKFLGGCFNDLSCLTQENFPKLEELELWHCKKLIQPHIQLASLKMLSAMCCDSITNFSISFLPNLEQLTVNCCKEVNVIHISECPSLRKIDISFLPSLPHFTLPGKFPQLHTLQLSFNKRLSSVTLGAVDDAFSRLIFRGLENLEVMPHGVERLPLLQELDLHDCKKLKTLPFGNSQDISLYPSLRFLDLAGTSISKAQLSQRLISLKPRPLNLPWALERRKRAGRWCNLSSLARFGLERRK